MTISLPEQNARIVLEAFGCLDLHMRQLIDSSDSEDDKAEIGNDLIAARILAERIQNEATELFGPNILIQYYPKE